MPRYIFILFGVLILAFIFIIGSGRFQEPRLPSKPFLVRSQIDFFEGAANDERQTLLRIPHIDNKAFVSALGVTGYSVKQGQLIDPWGYPYIITAENDQIVLKSVGLERYEKMTPFWQWFEQ